MPKYPDISYTVYGLTRKGYLEEAAALIECNIRDIIRANCVFAEQYTIGDTPYPDGVRPSLFGMAGIIDFVMLKNGFDYDKGLPYTVRLFEGDCCIRNIPIRGRKLNISISGKTGKVKASGSYLATPLIFPMKIGDSQLVGSPFLLNK
jgi:hypothetical protein